MRMTLSCFSILVLLIAPVLSQNPDLDVCNATKSQGLLQSHALHDKSLTTTLATTPDPNLALAHELAADSEDASDAGWEVEDQDTIMRMDSWADADTNTTTTATLTNISTLETGSSDVSCGGHRAASCKDCPQGNGAGWCNGDCFWKEGKCSKPGRLTPENPYGCFPDGRCQARTCSIHFNYQRPSGAREPSWFYNEVKPTSTSSSSFFAAATTSYGYAGLQTIWKDTTRAKDRAVICSIWDQSTGNAKMEKCGSGVYCTGFGGEGTGAKAMWYFDWSVGKHHAFMMHRKDAGNGRIEHACWFYAEELETTYPGGWKHIATVTSGRNWAGSTFRDSGSFVEQWTHQYSNEKRQSELGPAYYKNEEGAWHQSRTTKFSSYYDQSRLRAGTVRCDHVSAGQAPGTRRLFMATGGTRQAPSHLRRAPRFLAYPKAACGLPTPLYFYEANKKTLFKDALMKTSGSVSCGGHRGLVCADCPKGHGMAWCNGECQWKYGQCMRPKSSLCPPRGVSCGGHRADSCANCPGKHGASWCNGECLWSRTQKICRDK